MGAFATERLGPSWIDSDGLHPLSLGESARLAQSLLALWTALGGLAGVGCGTHVEAFVWSYKNRESVSEHN